MCLQDATTCLLHGHLDEGMTSNVRRLHLTKAAFKETSQMGFFGSKGGWVRSPWGIVNDMQPLPHATCCTHAEVWSQ
jgi:hypothetical protein